MAQNLSVKSLSWSTLGEIVWIWISFFRHSVSDFSSQMSGKNERPPALKTTLFLQGIAFGFLENLARS